MKSASKILSFPDRQARRKREELAFLPAALEIAETPPSPIGRAIGYSIVAVFAVALIWAYVGTVDIVAVAPGKIIPSGRIKMIQPLETGVVRTIEVTEGQSVKAGDILVELDPTSTTAELTRFRNDLAAARLDAARLRAALAAKGGDPLLAFRPPEGLSPDMVQMSRRLLLSQVSEQASKLASIDGQIAQKEAERGTLRASLEKIKAVIEPLEQRVEIRKQMFNKELGSRLVYLTELQDLVGQRKELVVYENRLKEADSAIAVLAESRTRTAAEYERGLLDELAKAEQKAAGLEQDIIRAEQRTRLQTLTAPVDGVVQQLAIHTIGGVVTPAQALMVIVPADSRLEIEAMISNRDIGFVEAGQPAEIKVDTFNFTRYGLLHGRVLSISNDAISRDKPVEKSAATPQGADAASSEPRGQELSFAARVSFDRMSMQVEGKTVNLSPGMAVTVEIKTGSRRIIDYLLSPIARYRHDSMRER
jgi:hemolysin D